MEGKMERKLACTCLLAHSVHGELKINPGENLLFYSNSLSNIITFNF